MPIVFKPEDLARKVILWGAAGGILLALAAFATGAVAVVKETPKRLTALETRMAVQEDRWARVETYMARMDDWMTGRRPRRPRPQEAGVDEP